MPARLTLIGSRGCGKTTIGTHAAAALGWSFLDLDAEIARRDGTSIASIFTHLGEAAFRDLESRALASALAEDGAQVLSTGGGCVLRDENRALLRSHGGAIVFIDTPVAVLQARLRLDQGQRPSLTGAGVADEVARVLAVREPLYRQVATAVVAGDRSVASIVEELVRIVENLTKTSSCLQKRPMA
jgi:shikimate kinase